MATPKQLHDSVRNFVTDLLELGGGIVVHENGMLSYQATPNDPIIFVLKDGKKKKKKLYTYTVDLQDPEGHLLNPLNEDCTTLSSDLSWFYQELKTIYLSTFWSTIEFMITCCDAKAPKVKSPSLLKAIQYYSDLVDEKTLDEVKFLRLSSDKNEILSIMYYRKRLQTVLQTCFDMDKEQTYLEKYKGKVRKKTWNALKQIISCIFGIEDISAGPLYERTTDDPAAAMFCTYIDVLQVGWTKLLPYIAHMCTDEFFTKTTDQLVRIEKNLERVPEYRTVVNWCKPVLETETSPHEKPRFERPRVDIPNPAQTKVTPTQHYAEKRLDAVAKDSNLSKTILDPEEQKEAQRIYNAQTEVTCSLAEYARKQQAAGAVGATGIAVQAPRNLCGPAAQPAWGAQMMPYGNMQGMQQSYQQNPNPFGFNQNGFGQGYAQFGTQYPQYVAFGQPVPQQQPAFGQAYPPVYNPAPF